MTKVAVVVQLTMTSTVELPLFVVDDTVVNDNGTTYSLTLRIALLLSSFDGSSSFAVSLIIDNDNENT